MKKFWILFSTGILFSTTAAQQISYGNSSASNRVQDENSAVDRNALIDGAINYAEINGSPYFQKDFVPAHIGNMTEQTSVRYNIFTDQMEALRGSTTIILSTEQPFHRIELLSGEVFEFLNNGYLMLIKDTGTHKLYRKENLRLIAAIPAATSFETDRPARFEKLKPVYFIRNSAGLTEIPKDRKKLLKQFPEHKSLVESIFRSNGDLQKEEKLVQFVSAIKQKTH